MTINLPLSTALCIVGAFLAMNFRSKLRKARDTMKNGSPLLMNFRYNESVDFIAGLIPENLLLTSTEAYEGTTIFDGLSGTLENVTDIFV